MRVEYKGKVHEFPDGWDDAKVQAALRSVEAAPAGPQVMPGAGAAAVAPTASLSSMVPGAMGMLGSLVPGPAGVAASGGLQALGEFGRQAVTGPPGIENPLGIAQQGAVGAGSAAAGGILTKTIGGVAKMGMAIGGGVKPSIAKTLVEEGVNISHGRFGAGRLSKIKGSAIDDANRIYSETSKTVGRMFPVKQLSDAVRKSILTKPMSMSRQRAFKRAADKVDKDWPAKLGPIGLRGFKQEQQDVINYAKRAKTVGSVKHKTAEILSRQARGNLINIPKFGPKIEAADARIGKLMDAETAMRGAVDRRPGGNIGSMRYLTGVLDHPTLYSTLALMLNALGRPANLATRALGSAAFPPGIAEEE